VTMHASMEPHTAVIFTHGGGRMANQFVLHANLLAFCLGQRGRFSLVNASIWPYYNLFESGFDILGRADGQVIRAVEIAELLRPLLRRVPHQVYRLALPIIHKSARRLRVGRLARRLNVGTVALRGLTKLDLDAADTVEALGRWPAVLLSGWDIRAHRQILSRRLAVLSKMKPRAEILAAAESGIRPLRQHFDFLIGVHIRHGDYRRFLGGKYWFPAVRYAEWMRQALEKYANRGRVGFYVCSDEAHDPNLFDGLNAHLGWTTSEPTYNGLVDCLRLSQCELILHPPSTFGWWAGYVGNVPRHELGHWDFDLRDTPIAFPPGVTA
jgi:hypothetical protein